MPRGAAVRIRQGGSTPDASDVPCAIAQSDRRCDELRDAARRRCRFTATSCARGPLVSGRGGRTAATGSGVR